MITERTNNAGNSRLALIFAGWGMDTHPFAGIDRHGYDMAVAYDYGTSATLPDWIDDYTEICLIAWSYGVCMAERFIEANPQLPITLKVAVNGTSTPVDDLTGIPRPIYQGTLDGLSEHTLFKFYRRICKDGNRFKAFRNIMPQRDIASLRKELAIFGSLQQSKPAGWDIIYISSNDAIIPPANQRRAWHSHSDVRILDDGHMPDFNHILADCLIDKTDVAQRFSRSSLTYDSNATIQRHMCSRVSEIILNHRPAPDTMIEIGPGTGILTDMYSQRLHPKHLELWDITDIATDLPGIHRKCDAETDISNLPSDSVDLIASSATIQWMNSPKQFAIKCAKALRNGGLAVFSTFGPETFHEIAPILPSPLHYMASDAWRELKLVGYDIDVNEEMHTLEFKSPQELLRHISSTGVNGCGVTATAAQRACRTIIASDIHSLSYHCIYISILKNTYNT